MAEKSSGSLIKLVPDVDGVLVPESELKAKAASAGAAAAEKAAPSRPTEAMKMLTDASKKPGGGKLKFFVMAAAAVVALGYAGYKYFTAPEPFESGVVLEKDGDNKIGKAKIIQSNERFTSMALMNAFGEIQKGNGYETKAKTGLDLAATQAVLQTIQKNEKDFIGQLDTKGVAEATLIQSGPTTPRFEYKSGGYQPNEAAQGSVVTVKLSQGSFDFSVVKPDGNRSAMHFDNNEYAQKAFKAPAPKAPKPSNSGPS